MTLPGTPATLSAASTFDLGSALNSSFLITGAWERARKRTVQSCHPHASPRQNCDLLLTVRSNPTCTWKISVSVSASLLLLPFKQNKTIGWPNCYHLHDKDQATGHSSFHNLTLLKFSSATPTRLQRNNTTYSVMASFLITCSKTTTWSTSGHLSRL